MAHSRLASLVGGWLALSLAVGPAANADPLPTRFVLGGAEYALLDKLPSIPLINKYVTPNLEIGAGFHPGTDAVQIHYPGRLFPPGTIGDHIQTGADNLDAAIKAAVGPLVVVGQSEGTVVIDMERARLENDPAAPPPDQLSFLMFNHPMRGLATTLFRYDFHIPIVDVIVTEPVESRYDSAVVIHEYDPWGDFPDRPWNLVALLNSAMGMLFLHQIDSDVPADIPPGNITTTVNSKGATDTTYFVPTRHLPLTEVLRIVGVPDRAVDGLDAAIRPIIDAGYSRNDKPGDRRPYLEHGALRTQTRTVGAARDVGPATTTGPAGENLYAASSARRPAARTIHREARSRTATTPVR